MNIKLRHDRRRARQQAKKGGFVKWDSNLQRERYQIIKCCGCGAEFTLAASEKQFYIDRNLKLPLRCPECRQRRRQRAKKTAGQGITWPIRCEDGTLDVLPMRRENGTLDTVPHVTSWNIITEGRYSEYGKGFKTFNLDRGTVGDLLQENTEG